MFPPGNMKSLEQQAAIPSRTMVLQDTLPNPPVISGTGLQRRSPAHISSSPARRVLQTIPASVSLAYKPGKVVSSLFFKAIGVLLVKSYIIFDLISEDEIHRGLSTHSTRKNPLLYLTKAKTLRRI